MRKFLFWLLVLSVVFAVAAWLGGGWLLGYATRSQLPRIEGFASRGRIAIANTRFDSVSFDAWPPGAEWDGITAETRVLASGTHPERVLAAAARSVTVSIESWSPMTVDVRLAGFELGAGLEAELPGEELPFNTPDSGIEVGRVTDGYAELPGMPVTANPGATVAELAESLRELFVTGSTTRNLKLGARVHLRLRGTEMSGRLDTERIAGRSVLRLNRDDVEEMARHYERPLTNGEKEVLAGYPLRAVSLLRIKEYAERLSKALARNDPKDYGEDFSRHIIWSYWLTRVYGDEFSQRVTDAHEEAKDDPVSNEHEQDYANNAIGRRYADTGMSENQMLKSIRTDPSIVRGPN